MTAARRLLRRLQRLLPTGRGPGATVLCYHLVDAGTGSAVDLPAERFAAQMEELAAIAEVVPLAEAVRRVAAEGADGLTSPRPLVVLTFDDAYANFASAAWPVLERLGLPATLFVPVGFLEGDAGPPNRAAELPAIGWQTLRELRATGLLTPGSHTWSHPDLTKLPAAAVRAELVRSRERLEERLGVPVTSFCYPRGLWSPAVEREVGRVYELAAIGGGGRLTPGRVRPLRIERISLRRDAPASLAPLLGARVWLEERLADRARRLRG